jgi:hypothetical protein
MRSIPQQEHLQSREMEKMGLYSMRNTPVNVNLWYLKNATGQVMGTINDAEISPSGFLDVDVTGAYRRQPRDHSP